MEITRVRRENHDVYGAKKTWHELNQQGISMAGCTVARIMCVDGIRKAVRGRKVITTVPDDTAQRPLDLVSREFKATTPNQLWVADLTYAATWRGFVYVAFVIDVFARRIVGWRASSSLRSDLALDALEQALWDRQVARGSGLIHHSDRGSQYLAITYTERLKEAGIELSVESVGNSYDNALAESLIGLFKTEVIRRKGPWSNLEHVEYATLEWVAWYNNRRLFGPLGYVPPAAHKTEYYRTQGPRSGWPESSNHVSGEPGAVHR